MKHSDSQDAAKHVGRPRLSHQDQLDEWGQHQDQQRLRRGQTAAAQGGWPPRSCRGPIATPSQSSAAADPAPAIMSSTSGSSASSVCSDGRKRKESSPDTAAASKRYRHQDPLCLTSLSTVCTAAGSSLTQIEEAAGLQLSTDPATSVSCVEDANEQCSRFGIGPLRYAPGLRAMSKSARTNRPSCKRVGEASCDATASGISTRLYRARTRLTRGGTSEDSGSESDEDVTSSGPGQGQAMGHGLEFVSPTVASRKRKVDKSDIMEAELTECSTRDTRLRFAEEDAEYPTRTVSSGDVDLASSSADGQSTSAPLFVLSSGRLSRGEEILLGRRPPTVDDEFDRYFAKLIL